MGETVVSMPGLSRSGLPGLFMSAGIIGITVRVADILIQEPHPWECRSYEIQGQPVAWVHPALIFRRSMEKIISPLFFISYSTKFKVIDRLTDSRCRWFLFDVAFHDLLSLLFLKDVSRCIGSEKGCRGRKWAGEAILRHPASRVAEGVLQGKSGGLPSKEAVVWILRTSGTITMQAE